MCEFRQMTDNCSTVRLYKYDVCRYTDICSSILPMSAFRTAPDHWHDHGVRVIPGDKLDPDTAQTPGMSRAVATNNARVGAQKI
jgi:hypothetical protein